jgi:ATP-dependent DNA helicase DinG
MTFNYQPNFPYKTVRPEQDLAINFALDAFRNKGKRFVIIEAGTGVGKSAVGLTVAKMMGSGAYFLTTQKVLQDQYIRDFGHLGLKSIKSSTNFRCKYYKGKDCSSALRELKVSKDSKFKACCGGGCIYKAAKTSFINAEIGTTNFPYFLAETNYSAQLEPRGLLVVDECHNAEIQLGKFISIEISEHFAETALKLTVPQLTTMHQVITWTKNAYLPKLAQIKKHMESQIEKFSLGARMQDFVQVAKRYELIDKHLCKLNRFMEVFDKDNWIMNTLTTEKRGKKKYEFKPIDISPFSENNLFRSGEKILLMSATVMNRDAFCEILGIPKEECAFISIPSPFPVSNRPIIFSPIASMTKRNIDEGLPKMAEAVKAILEEHKDEKGIIHCHSYKIANYLKRNIRSSRLLLHDPTNRDKVLYKHINGRQPTVLLSPSMSEGVDLKDDTSRFQILCKVPYPYLGDKLVSKRMHKWRWWYPLQTAKTIVQSVGRSVRSTSDHAVTYILDSDWQRFYGKNKNVFPEDFKQCIK